MYRILLSILVWLSLGANLQLRAQCTPPSADECEQANVLCSLDEVNGYACANTTYSNPTGCTPLCPTGGAPHNTGWWAFVTDGGSVNITITFGNCQTGQGVQMGIWGDCFCSESVVCNPNCNSSGGSFVLSATLTPCKIYYLFVDGCNGDICDFSLTTSGGAAPMLNPLGLINNEADRIIDLCQGYCGKEFFITGQQGGCEPEYVWTLDGTEVGDNSDRIRLDWPDEGDFQICVTGIIGNPNNGSICDQEGPQCATVKVRKIAPARGADRVLCYERTPFIWHSQVVTPPGGEYMHTFINPTTCCEFDSIVNFIVLPVPEEPDIFFIGCDPTDIFEDPLTNKIYPGCNAKKVVLLKSTDPWRCDSAYTLNTVSLDFVPRWQIRCIGAMIEIEPNIQNRTKECGGASSLGLSYEYAWYIKSKPNVIISTDERLQTDKKDDYCLLLTVTSTFGPELKVCSYTYCEPFNEDDLKPKAVPIKGDTVVCIGRTGIYFIDTIIRQKVIFYNWSIQGGIIVSPNPFDTTAIEVLWNGPPGLTGEVCLWYETDCGRSPETCILVRLAPPPKPNAGPNDTICALDYKLTGIQDVGGQWVQLSGPPSGNTSFANPNDPKTNISVNIYGIYQYAWTESRLGCSTTDTVTVIFNSNPAKGPEAFICDGTNTKYRVRFQINGGTAPFTLVQGTGTIDVNNIYTSGFIQNLVDQTITVRDRYGCQFTWLVNYECRCTNSIGDINNTPINLCEDGSVTVTYDNSTEIQDPEDTVIFFIYTDPSDPLGSRVRNITSLTIPYDPSFQYGVTYYVGVILGRSDKKGDIDPNGGCLREDYGKPFTFYQIPNPNAGPDGAVCGVVYDLNGLSSVPGSVIRWKLIGGPGGVLFTNPNTSVTQVSAQGGFGTYQFEIEETNNSLCTKSDIVEITFNPSPNISTVDKICVDYATFTYRVEATIQGGQPPFTLLTGGGKLVGNVFFSDTLISLDTFRILVQDANGCISELIADIHNCNCGNINAGDLDTSITRVCVDQCISITNIINETITPGEDGVMFILSKGFWNAQDPTTRLDTFFSIMDQICFDPTKMTEGVTYYVTRVVGDDIAPNDGVVDAKDPCLRATRPQPMVWVPYPLADAGPHDSICGLNFNLNANLTLGNGTWRLLSGPGSATFNNVGLPNASTDVTNYGTYIYEWTVANFSCTRIDTVHVTFWDQPEFIDNSVVIECDNTAEKYRVSIQVQKGDQPSWIVDGDALPGGNLAGSFVDATTWQTDWILSGGGYHLEVNDRHNCLIDNFDGTHICQCITDIGDLDLTPIILCADGTAAAIYNPTTGTKDGNDVVKFVLYDGTPNSPQTGNIINFNDNGVFTFDPTKMTLGRTYYIAVFMGNIDPSTGNVDFSDRCLTNTPGVPVTWYAYPVAKIAGPTLLTCAVTSVDLNGVTSTSGSGQTLQYTWSTQNGQFVNPNQLNNSNAPVNQPGTYKLFVKDPVSGCTHETTFTVDQNINKPGISLAPPQVITCDRDRVDLNGNASSQGPEFSGTWTGPGQIDNANTYKATVYQQGTYTFIIRNSSNGCLDSSSVTVTEDKRAPIADIQPKGTLTCTINEIQLDGSGSRGTSGNIGTYSWFSTNGNIIAGQGTKEITVGKPGGDFILRVKDDNNGCLSFDTIQVVELGNPLAAIDGDPQDPRCFGERNGRIQILQVLDKNNQVVNNLQYSINGGQYVSAGDFPNLGQGTYKITIRDKDGCLKDTSFVLIEPGPLSMKVIRSIVVDQGSRVDLDTMILDIAGGTAPNRDTSWYNISLQQNWDANKVYTADSTYDFEITTTDDAGCIIKERVRVTVRIIRDVWWPNVFSPNADKINDTWNLFGKRVRSIRNVQIYDRWGEMVYTGENLKPGTADNQGWNGFFRNEYALPGVYVFYAEVEFEGGVGFDKFKGDFTLLR
ncbi:MAG: gliding motility-associated C-terminal domain-containing protein [Bacteroidota bacterium]|nr:gliding motility-associated C-terminal domain-containing protein [Bacteroidota bacterium]